MRYLVVHAHLYQPPRENPWTEQIHRQPSARPFHDWNVRVSDECYERLGGAGVRGPDGRIHALVNLFSRLSFNIGPTLACWLEQDRPEVLRDARRGDETARARTGAGGAMMQPYGHPIMPLADRREKRLQVAWGKADFQRRFGRDPEGIWLPETAVDMETLEICGEMGLKYTILAPEQIVQVRRVRTRKWQDVSGARTPTHKPMYVTLPSGKRFTVFSFHGPLSRSIAFGGTLASGERLLGEIRSTLDALTGDPGIVLLAADGETFGHHQAGAEEALAEALERCRMSGAAKVANLAEVLASVKPGYEARLAEPSSWSCAHGVGRWSRACGCRMGDHDPEWSWAWREPLRHAMSTLRNRVFSLIERRGEMLFKDPWAALEAHGEVLAHLPSRDRIDALIDEHGVNGLADDQRERAGILLELTRQVLFSATSCGWFFDDIAGIEATQVLRHAARACELTRRVFDVNPEPNLVKRLADAPANEPGLATGADVYQSRAAHARHEPQVAIASHGLNQLEAALAGRAATAGFSSAFGLFAVDENQAPVVDTNDGERLVVTGHARATHLRTGESWEGEYVITSPGPGKNVKIRIAGEPAEMLCSTLRERILQIAASRAATLLPAPDPKVLHRVAWIGRKARKLGAPLPPPFLEAISGGGRALIRECLSRPQRSPQTQLQDLLEALIAVQSAGLEIHELEDLRPEMGRRLALLGEWILARGLQEAVEPLSRLITTSAAVMGEPVLGLLRRELVHRASQGEDSLLASLAAAAGMSPDALKTVDTSVRAGRDPRAEELLDDLA